MRWKRGDLRRPEPDLHSTGSGGHVDLERGVHELRMLQHFGMTPSSDILDVGCGIGRLAHECASYLDDDATYAGLDIAPVPIDWLNTHYAPRLPGFRFDLLDVHSERYRPDAGVSPETVRLPYDDDSFDVACAYEVFMHVSLQGIANYLHEIARVLRPGGLAVLTLVAIYPGEPTLENRSRPYVEISPGVHTIFPRRKNMSMAYDVGVFRSMLADAGLNEVELIQGNMHIPIAERPGQGLGAGPIPELFHACDLFAVRTSP
ncbi:MAG: class I SAM-dependent methyltransferase [Acidimicrobiia bacterium]|nr:class I SAM-dependent methyltransferase [Acidimicrobiia bacterium]